MSFWTVHGYFIGFFFLLLLFVLPRFAMFAFLVLPIGIVSWIAEPFGLTGFAALCVAVLGWVAWLLAPRFLVAILATVLYWDVNPSLCLLAWLIAFGMLRTKKKAAEKMARERHEKQTQAEAEWSSAGQGNRTRRPPQTAGQRAQQWWEVLGVSPSASVEMIKAAYRAVAKATHPDSAPDGKGDVDKFRKANEAYKRGLKRDGT